MAYSKFEQKHADKILGRGLEITDAAKQMIADCVRAHINFDVILDDIEAKLINAAYAETDAEAQEWLDSACFAHDCHFDGAKTLRHIEKPKVRKWGVFDEEGEMQFTFPLDDDGREYADEIAERHEGWKVEEVIA